MESTSIVNDLGINILPLEQHVQTTNELNNDSKPNANENQFQSPYKIERKKKKKNDDENKLKNYEDQNILQPVLPQPLSIPSLNQDYLNLNNSVQNNFNGIYPTINSFSTHNIKNKSQDNKFNKTELTTVKKSSNKKALICFMMVVVFLVVLALALGKRCSQFLNENKLWKNLEI
jgi:hypothetical protein